MTKEQIHIYTDGACSGNPGKGGYGIVMEWVGKPYKKEFYDSYQLTTNNRMELKAVIEGLKAIKEPCEVVITSDSNYVIKAIINGLMIG